MKQGMTGGFLAVFTAVLLATVTSVYADHTATGKGTSTVAPQVSAEDAPQILAEFDFVVAKQGPNPSLQPGLNLVQSEMNGRDGRTSFQTFMISTAFKDPDPFTISTEPAGRTVRIEGEGVSTTFRRVGPERQLVAELVPFTAIGVDTAILEAGVDLFTLIVEYSAKGKQGPLFASLGFGVCDATTCTITFDGPVKTGDIFVHTAGDE